MATDMTPQSIFLFDVDEDFCNPDLDLEYIDASARELAASLRTRVLSTEIAYQPGDGTFYGIVFTPLAGLITAPPRVKSGVEWDRHAVRGLDYEDGNVLVSWIEHQAYPLALAGRQRDIAANYVAEHWGTSLASGVTLALLFRAMAWHFDNPPNNRNGAS